MSRYWLLQLRRRRKTRPVGWVLLFPGGGDGTDGGVVCVSPAAASVQLTCVRRLVVTGSCALRCAAVSPRVHRGSGPELFTHRSHHPHQQGILHQIFFSFFFLDSAGGLLHGSDDSLQQQRCFRRRQRFIGETNVIYLPP